MSSGNLLPLIDKNTTFRVSTVLNKDTKSYGKQFLCDGKEETCWNSDQGSNQWIIINFKELVTIKRIEIKFQGGFCSLKAKLEALDQSNTNNKEFKNLFEFYPQDNNSNQVFDVISNENDSSSDCFRLQFENLTDFFGRLIIYNLSIYGTLKE